MRGAIAAGLLLVAAPGAALAQPSFDCRRAGNAVERAICASPSLSALDRDLAAAFLPVGGQPGVADAQRAWVARRNRDCGPAFDKGVPADGEACLRASYAARLAALRAAPQAPSDMKAGTPPTPPPAAVPEDWAGSYRPRAPGLTGELRLARRPDGRWNARLETARSAPPNPTCEAEWIAEEMSDGALVGRTDGGTGPTILLRRAGGAVAVTATEATTLCGASATFTGSWGR